MKIRTKIAIPAITAAALIGSGGIAYANVANHPSPQPSDSITEVPTPTPTDTLFPNPLPRNCYRATDHETIVAPGHRTVREDVRAIVCQTRLGPIVFVDTNAVPLPTPFGGPRR